MPALVGLSRPVSSSHAERMGRNDSFKAIPQDKKKYVRDAPVDTRYRSQSSASGERSKPEKRQTNAASTSHTRPNGGRRGNPSVHSKGQSWFSKVKK